MPRLFRRLQAWRSQPVVDPRAGLSLASPPEGFIAHRSVGEEFGFFAEASGLFGKALFKGRGLLKSSAAFRHSTTSGPNRGVRITDS